MPPMLMMTMAGAARRRNTANDAPAASGAEPLGPLLGQGHRGERAAAELAQRPGGPVVELVEHPLGT